jgi:cytochrome oxidase Cu insertion factor (SCO1/SenC/PrrC family)
VSAPGSAPHQPETRPASETGVASAFAALAVVGALAAVIAVVGWRARRPTPSDTTLPVTAPVEIPAGSPIPEFTLTDQQGRPITRADLAGKVWIVGFIFTRCPSTCPMITGSMKRLSEQITDPDVGFLSISVDPAYDVPEVLRAFAADYGADQPRWRFVTGDRLAIYDLVVRGFKLALEEVPDRPEKIIHSDRLAIVDRAGVVRAYARGTEPESVRGIPARVAALLAEK